MTFRVRETVSDVSCVLAQTSPIHDTLSRIRNTQYTTCVKAPSLGTSTGYHVFTVPSMSSVDNSEYHALLHRTKYHKSTTRPTCRRACKKTRGFFRDPDRARYHPPSTYARRRAVRPCRRTPSCSPYAHPRRTPLVAVRPLCRT